MHTLYKLAGTVLTMAGALVVAGNFFKVVTPAPFLGYVVMMTGLVILVATEPVHSPKPQPRQGLGLSPIEYRPPELYVPPDAHIAPPPPAGGPGGDRPVPLPQGRDDAAPRTGPAMRTDSSIPTFTTPPPPDAGNGPRSYSAPLPLATAPAVPPGGPARKPAPVSIERGNPTAPSPHPRRPGWPHPPPQPPPSLDPRKD